MPTQNEELKRFVRDKYSEIARQTQESNEGSCCGSTAKAEPSYTIFSEDYSQTEGYFEEADLGLGCGIPTEGLTIQEGSTVLDLGSGAGNDCFVARAMVGEQGYVIGVDFSQEMVDKAIANRQKLGYENVSFRLGDIEGLPVADGEVDYILSNCVMNLVPNKAKAFAEVYRSLKPGGVFSISDIVTDGELPKGFKEDASLYAGCIAGALERETYLSHIRSAGFEALTIQKEKQVNIPDSLLQKHLSQEDIHAFHDGAIGIVSITVQGHKPNR